MTIDRQRQPGDCEIEQIPSEFISPQSRHYRSVRFRYSLPKDHADHHPERHLAGQLVHAHRAGEHKEGHGQVERQVKRQARQVESLRDIVGKRNPVRVYICAQHMPACRARQGLGFFGRTLLRFRVK